MSAICHCPVTTGRSCACQLSLTANVDLNVSSHILPKMKYGSRWIQGSNVARQAERTTQKNCFLQDESRESFHVNAVENGALKKKGRDPVLAWQQHSGASGIRIPAGDHQAEIDNAQAQVGPTDIQSFALAGLQPAPWASMT